MNDVPEINPKPNYPIVIRRGGPRDKEAFESLKEIGEKEGFDFDKETKLTNFYEHKVKNKGWSIVRDIICN